MKFRTLLLGTAAAFATVGGAQAADLAVAEPVDYVKVCDAYGVGYWYIPGTDTCLRIGGYVKLNVFGYSDKRYLNFAGLAVQPGAPINGNDRGVDVSVAFPYFDDYKASWSFVTEAGVTVTAQSMTDYGPLTAFVEFRGLSDNAVLKGTSRPSAGDIDLGGPLAYIDTMYLKIGPVTAGFLASLYDYGGGFTYDLRGDFRHDVRTDQLTFAWNWGGWGLGVSVADPRDQQGGSEFYTGDYPDIVAAIYGAGGGFDWKGSLGVGDTIFGTAFAGSLGATFTWANGAAIRLQGAVANAEGAYWVSNSYAPSNGGGTAWSILASGIWYWTPAFSTAVTGGYSDAGFTDSELWAVSAGAYWTIAKNATSGIEFQYLDGEAIDDSWVIKAELKRSFGS